MRQQSGGVHFTLFSLLSTSHRKDRNMVCAHARTRTHIHTFTHTKPVCVHCVLLLLRTRGFTV